MVALTFLEGAGRFQNQELVSVMFSLLDPGARRRNELTRDIHFVDVEIARRPE
jgi:hypothetical protein